MHLSALYRYPLKSGRHELLEASQVDSLGLAGDRRWMLVDAETGRCLTQRTLPGMSQLSALYGKERALVLSAQGFPELVVAQPDDAAPLRGVTIWSDSLRVPDAGDAAAEWLTRFIGKPVRLVYVPAHRTRRLEAGYGLADDRVAFADGYPLLLIGQGSLDDLCAKVGRPMEMLRFRPNLVVEGAPAFAEDGWRRIRIGDVEFRVVKPCSRCIMTTIDPATAQRSPDREPMATLKTYRLREGGLMFGQNLVSDQAGRLEVGMPVTVLE